jgi:hypothetical protein
VHTLRLGPPNHPSSSFRRVRSSCSFRLFVRTHRRGRPQGSEVVPASHARSAPSWSSQSRRGRVCAWTATFRSSLGCARREGGQASRGMSQRAFAVAAGLSQSRIARLETARVRTGPRPPDGAGDGRSAPGDRRRGRGALDAGVGAGLRRGRDRGPGRPRVPRRTCRTRPTAGSPTGGSSGTSGRRYAHRGRGRSDVPRSRSVGRGVSRRGVDGEARDDARSFASAAHGPVPPWARPQRGGACFDPPPPRGNLAGRCAPAFACPLTGGRCRSGAVGETT